MFIALGTQAAAQSNGTEATAKALAHLLDYAATHPDAVIWYCASGMVLYIHSDASYLSERKACSRVGGHFFLSNMPTNPTLPPTNAVPNNGATHTVSNILKNIMPSATEAKFAGLYHNACDDAMHAMHNTHQNGPSATCQHANPNRQFHCIRNHQQYSPTTQIQGNGHVVYWRPGSTNLGNYFTKHHLTAHHRHIRPTYLHIAQRAQRANAAQAQKPLASCLLQQRVVSPRAPLLPIQVPPPRSSPIRAPLSRFHETHSNGNSWWPMLPPTLVRSLLQTSHFIRRIENKGIHSFHFGHA